MRTASPLILSRAISVTAWFAYRNRGYTAPASGFELLTCFNLNIGTLEAFGNYTANLYVTGSEITFTGFDGKGD